MTPDSHDQFRNARQIEKASLQLAVNANVPEIKNLIVKLLNELQPEVNRCHASKEGQKLFNEAQVGIRQTGREQPPSSQPPEEDERASQSDNSGKDLSDDDDQSSNYDIDDDYESDEVSDDDLESEVGEPRISDGVRPYKACRKFAKISHPTEEEGYHLALLSLPPGKVWTVQDLGEEHFLHMGLRLLYNRIHGSKRLSLGRNIHICYDHLPDHLLQQISKKLTKIETRRIQKLLIALGK